MNNSVIREIPFTITLVDTETDYSCPGCEYFGREYENNDIRCNCRKSEFYLDVPPGEPCNHWRPKE